MKKGIMSGTFLAGLFASFIVVYAYGSSEMTVLLPGDTTTELTTNVTMKEISNAEYSEIADINIYVRGYGIDINGGSDVASEWEECKAMR